MPVDWLLSATGAYAALGLAFAIPFVTWGAGTIDPAAKVSGLGFKVLIIPGAIALWPLLLAKWWRHGQ